MERMLTLAIALALAFGPEAQAEPIGFLATTIGDVHVAEGGSGAWQAARRDAEIEIGDAIRTGTGAQAKIVLVDDTLLQIDEESELRIESFHVGSAATKERSILRQTRGRLRTTVGAAFGGSTRIEVHIPTAAIGIKGTDFETIEAPGSPIWEACLLAGGIDVSNPHGAASPPVGQCVYAYPDKAPGDPHPNPHAPLVVKQDGGDGTRKLTSGDFSEKIHVDVGAGDGGSGSGYEGGSDKNNEDELEPNVDIEPPIDPQFEG